VDPDIIGAFHSVPNGVDYRLIYEMNLHQKLKSIELQRDRIARRPSSGAAANWENPTVGKATIRRRLKLESKPSSEGQPFKRGRLEIGSINQHGGHDSLVQRSLTHQLHRFEKILDSRIQEIREEIVAGQ